MTTIILMRHGETLSNIKQLYQGQGDGELSPLGIKQAKASSKYLKGLDIEAIYSSDLQRAQKTAEEIAKPHKLGVEALRDLRERYYGDWEGLKFSTLAAKYKILYKKWLIDPDKALIPRAEKLRDMQKRGVKTIEMIAQRHRGKTVLIVGHGGINRAILFHYLGLDLNNFWKIRQSNCCINIIEFRKPYPKLVLMNASMHLEGIDLLKVDSLT